MAAPGETKLNLVPIKTVVHGELTPLELFLDHGKEPVIIKGALGGHPLMRNNTAEYIADVCGDGYIDTVVYDADSESWAGHTGQKLMKIKEYVDGYFANASREEIRYAHSATFGMPFVCPALQHDVLIPALASKTLPAGGGIISLGHPTIFMGPPGSLSELHMDMYLMPFWLSVYMGKKKFRVIVFEEALKQFGV